VDLEYNVFVFFVNYTKPEQSELVKKFNEEKQKMMIKKIQKQPIKRTHDENDFMAFETLQEFRSKKQWDRITKNILENPEFYACVTSLDRKSFAIK
jgi:nitrogenase subunit NifH